MSTVVKGINDLLTINPTIAKEWDYEKNGELTPDNVSVRSNKKYWWKCEKQHTWFESPDRRSRGQNCPYCSGKRVWVGYNDLLSQSPKMASEWDYERNTEVKPDELTIGSHRKVWWKCTTCGFSWNVSPNERKNATRGCPRCAKIQRVESFKQTVIKPGINDLLSQVPELMSEWDYELNSKVNPMRFTVHSKDKVWWKCKQCGNSWLGSISNRATNGAGCPKCMKHAKTSFPEQAIFYYVHLIFDDAKNSFCGIKEQSTMELDVFIPSKNIGIEYDGIAWHNNTNSQKRDWEKYELCRKHNITLLRVSEFERFASKDCDRIIVRRSNDDKGLNEVIVELLKCIGIEDFDVDVSRDRSIIMQQYITVIGQKSIASKYPEEEKNWDIEMNNGLSARMVYATSNVSYWWRCELGHKYKARPANRLGTGNGCPFCSGRRILPGFNDFATKYPELLDEWDYVANCDVEPNSIAPGSARKVWWKCPRQHSYKASPNEKVYNHTKCPYCSNIKLLTGFNDLKTAYPQLITMWDYCRNECKPEDCLMNSHKLVWWTCSENHNYKRTISAQIKYSSCPICKDQELLIGYNDLMTKYPNLASEWCYEKNDSKPSDFTRTSKKRVWWKCKICSYEWQSVIATRIYTDSGCPKCGYAKKMQATRISNILKNHNSFADLFPDILTEWDYEKNDVQPNEITPGANRKIWWLCKEGHSYCAWLTDRTGKAKTGCPYCSGKRRMK